MSESIIEKANRRTLLKLVSRSTMLVALLAMLGGAAGAQTLSTAPTCNKTVTADVVALDQIIFYNRFGAFDPGGMMFALRRDVVASSSTTAAADTTTLTPGNVQLRADKRPRPLVLRVNEGDCLQVTFTNLLDPSRANVENHKFANAPDKRPYFGGAVKIEPDEDDPNGPTEDDGSVKLSQDDTPATRSASIHVNGLDLVGTIGSDGSNVGQNSSKGYNSLAAPGETRTYTWYAAKQGTYFLYSTAATTGGEGNGGQITHGLFGSINVEPKNSVWYRSQVTAEQMKAATAKSATGEPAKTPMGQPIINYNAAFANGDPVLNILRGNEIVYTDINAIVTDPSGKLQEDCTKAPPSGTCGQPYREYTVIFHDELETGAPAFPEFHTDESVFHSVRDGFGVNYGSSGAGSEILANRKKVGPAADCAECAYEEFFLESWANGDPALLVKYGPVDAVTGRAKATAGLYPDDPSNVHHSYLGDPVRFRNVHAGPKETHVFHLHAHQWLTSPRDENSTYLDSQTISPGAAFTYEINYGGSGNRNIGSPGDSIFHCHLYPHFAQGMWELWRSHDVFEDGTAGRNLPDGEIAGGTPNPAIVPIPYLFIRNADGTAQAPMGMPPMPSAEMPGYPFYMAGKAGHRPAQPPLGLEQDGGLPRHLVLEGKTAEGLAAIPARDQKDPIFQRVTSLNTDPNLIGFATKLTSANIQILPAAGTKLELVAQKFHQGTLVVPGSTTATVNTQYGWPAVGYTTFTPTGGTGAYFLVNGRAPVAGAPYSDPCPTTFVDGNRVTRTVPTRKYRAAWIQLDNKINNAGWHDRQGRIAVLEQDVAATLNGTRPTEPLFFRANSGDCIDYRVTNLIPAALNLDDFQVYQPTDIIGQHIHLVKFDVTSSDGAGNGWNYESGAFSPETVRDRIEANNVYQRAIGGTQILSPKVNPSYSSHPLASTDWLGAQTLIERWWADPLINTLGEDRTIRTVFTHDHFSPSGHQHHGLYAGLVIEQTDVDWQFLDGTPMGGPVGTSTATRADGGPTSYAANIIKNAKTGGEGSYREFNLEIGDFAIVYTPENIPVNPPNQKKHPLPTAIGSPIVDHPEQYPTPEAISSADPGTSVINYRNEPIPLRVAAKNTSGQFVQKATAAGDIANVFSSAVHGDPATPLFRTYEGDKVQIRLLQGAQEEQHVMNVHGVKWLFEPSARNSGYTNSQHIGISEHFEFVTQITAQINNSPKKAVDYFYESGATDNLWDGMWGLVRAFQSTQAGLAELPNNPLLKLKIFQDACPQGAPVRSFTVQARLARETVPGGALVYNERFKITDPNAIMFVDETELTAIQGGTKLPEPLILRALAGDCINLTLKNMLPASVPETASWNFLPPIVPGFNFNQLKTSNRVSLHPQLLAENLMLSDGSAVGFNPDTTVAPGGVITYRWYAGDQVFDQYGKQMQAPIEFGATSLRDMGDVIKHSSHGAVGSLIIEPVGATWTKIGGKNSVADITYPFNGAMTTFREFVAVYQDDLSLQSTFTFPDPNGRRLSYNSGSALMNLAGTDDSEDSGMKAFNYRTEPIWARGFGLPPETDLRTMGDQDYKNTLSSTDYNAGCGGACGDPATPVFTATVGTPVRFRLVHPAGHSRQHGFTVFGHHWNFEPWTTNSTVQGSNPFTFEIGSYSGFGPTRHFNVLTTAGGLMRVPGDYLYRTQDSFSFASGLWGIFRVTPVATTSGCTDPRMACASLGPVEP